MKTFARVLASTVFKIALFSAAITASLAAVVGSPDTIKKSVSDSNIYDQVVDGFFSEAQAKIGTEGQEALGDAAPELQKAAETAFTPDVLRDSSEQIIDGLYRWLNGDVQLPDFRVDLTEVKEQFVAAAGSAAAQHVEGLPACTAEQLQTIDRDANAFSLPCRPPFLSAAEAREQVLSELNSGEFLENPVITADSLPKDESGQTVFEQAKGVQDGFSLFKSLPWILLAVAAVCGIAAFFLSNSRRQGIKLLGISFLGTGLLLFIGTWLISFLLDRALRPGGLFSRNVENGLQEAILELARSLNSAFNRTLLIYCLVYIVVGAGTLLALHFTKPKDPDLLAKPDETKPDKTVKSEEPKAETPAPKAEEKSA